MAFQEHRLTVADVRKLTSTSRKNISGTDSNLFIQMDTAIDMMMPHYLAGNGDEYVSSSMKQMSGWHSDAARIHLNADRMKERMAQSLGEKPPELPTRAEFQRTLTELHECFDPKHPVGIFYRRVIKESLSTLNIGLEKKSAIGG